VVGELGGIGVPCADAIIEKNRINISHIIPEMSTSGIFKLIDQRFGDNMGGGELTDDCTAFALVFTGWLFSLSCPLDTGLTMANKSPLLSVSLTGLALKLGFSSKAPPLA
jgi:hypothetical protein